MFEFTNQLTFLNLTWTIEPTVYNIMLIYQYELTYQLGRSNPRAAVAVYGIIDRGVTSLLEAVRHSKPTFWDKTLRGAFVLLARARRALSTEIPEEFRGDEIEDIWLCTRGLVELTCASLSMQATPLAFRLGLPWTKYREVAQELSHDYVDGTSVAKTSKGAIKALEQLLDCFDHPTETDGMKFLESLVSVTGGDIASIVTPEALKTNLIDGQHLHFGGTTWSPDLDPRALSERALAVTTLEEAVEVEGLFHNLLQENAEQLDSPSLKVIIYDHLSLLAAYGINVSFLRWRLIHEGKGEEGTAYAKTGVVVIAIKIAAKVIG